MRILFVSFLFLYLITPSITQSCSNNTYSYEDDIAPILIAKCSNCHGGVSGYNVTTYANLLAGGNNCGPGVTPGDASASASSIIDKTQHSNGGPNASCGSNMPTGGTPLTPTEFLALETWIADGAQESCPNTACPSYLNLTGTESSSIAYVSGGSVSSNQNIAANVVVDYDATTEILLNQGFEVDSTAIFHAFINGCSN